MRLGSILLGLTVATAAPSLAQTPAARAQSLASEFSKFKNETRTSKGVTRTKYKEVVSEAWLAAAPAYSGRYVARDGMDLDITIDRTGKATGSGQDDGRFVLRDLAISAGLITGTKAYTNGRSEKFEAVFLKRSTRDAATARFSVHYGVGVLADEFRIFAAKQ